MKSFCIKTNNQEIINFILKNLEISSLENIYFSNKEFKCYKNVIIHYTGKKIEQFLIILSNIILDCILAFYEYDLIKRILNYNYFYFDNDELKFIENKCYENIILNDDRKNLIFSSILKYIEENKYMILDGFVNFRLYYYINEIEEIVDSTVQQFLIEREYNEFINVLKTYVNSKIPETSLIHLVYTNGESILLSENKNIINIESNIGNATYLSDISFSSNDYALNTLLALLPKKIELHLCSGSEDEFINTLKLIFGNRINLCSNCNICRTYRMLNNVK